MSDTTALLSLLKLRFNIENPSVEESYVYGYEAAGADVDEDENPFKSNTREYEHWSEGWWDGFYGKQPLFSLNEPVERLVTSNAIPVANESVFSDHHSIGHFLVKVLEITSVIGVVALVGYQMLELVA